jgi:glucose-1-phosphate cytidylyltransferase
MRNKKDIPVVILAGGKGTSVGSNTVIPKPMVEVNGIPILLHIMDYYASFGFWKFIITTGFRGVLIAEYVRSIPFVNSEFNIKVQNKKIIEDIKQQDIDRSEWDITVVDTGISENTGARISKIKHLLDKYAMFMVTYGDLISDVDLDGLIKFHKMHMKTATLVAVHSPSRFRILGLYGESDEVRGFADKPVLQKDYISGGFYVLNQTIFDLKTLSSHPECSFEHDVLGELVNMKQVNAYKYDGFWQPLDTERDKQIIINKLNC